MELILGTAQLTQRYGIMAAPTGPGRSASSILATAERLGVRTVDTAPAYGDAEAVIGRHGAAFTVHTKLPRDEAPAAALAASLGRLRRDSVEVLYLHDPDVVLDVRDPRLAAAAALVGERVGALGASIYTPEQFNAAVVDPRIAVVQVPLNLLDRRIDRGLLERAARSGTRVIARSALLQGLLADPLRAAGRIPALDPALSAFANLCGEFGRAPIEVALLWVQSLPAVSGLVVGAENPGQLESLVSAAGSAPLLAEEIALLDSLPKPPDGAADPRTWAPPPEPQGDRG